MLLIGRLRSAVITDFPWRVGRKSPFAITAGLYILDPGVLLHITPVQCNRDLSYQFWHSNLATSIMAEQITFESCEPHSTFAIQSLGSRVMQGCQ
jgi:hypothetical protein